MINIEAVVENSGILRACSVEGHAGFAKTGKDVCCAAISVLMRTAYNVLAGREGITVRGGAPDRGTMWIEADYTAETKEFLFAAGIFLMEGLRSVAQDYPKNCKLSIKKMCI